LIGRAWLRVYVAPAVSRTWRKALLVLLRDQDFAPEADGGAVFAFRGEGEIGSASVLDVRLLPSYITVLERAASLWPAMGPRGPV